MTFSLRSRAARRVLFYAGLSLALGLVIAYATAMPGVAHRGPLPALTAEHLALSSSLRAHVVMLSETIGERRIGHDESLERARAYIAGELREVAERSGLRIQFEHLGRDGSDARNVILTLPGASAELVVVGAHYDSAPGTPGANDNASGTAALLELAKRMGERRYARTLRFAFFANEEPPYFQNPGMGSLHHARTSRERGDQVHAMLSLESLGFYSDAPNSQRYPWPVGMLYPDRGNFVGFVGNLDNRALVRQAIAAFRASTSFPSEGAALPASMPGVAWSDHWAFWELDYPAIMVTDTAPFRDPNYHGKRDVAENLDYLRLARVTLGLEHVIARLTGT